MRELLVFVALLPMTLWTIHPQQSMSDVCTNGQLVTVDTVNKRYKCIDAPVTIPQGGFYLSTTQCAQGFSQVDFSGRYVLGTMAVNGDAGQTGGSSAYTPTGTINGISVAVHASHAHTYTDVIAHTHTIPVGATDDTSAPFDRADAGTNTAGANATTASGSTGIATGTTQGTTLTHSVTQGNFVGQQATLTPPYVKLIFCRKD